MSSVIVVPHRGLAAAKSRLASRLSADERAHLARRLLERVLRVAREADRGEMVVISPDPALAEIIAAAGARLVVQHGVGLNAGLEQARRDAVRDGCGMMTVLHGDLPLLSSADVRALVDAVPVDGGVAVGPDRAGAGTNALAMRPPDVIPFRFGPGSFEAHVAAATAAGTTVVTVERPGIAFDLDTPDDLDRLLAGETAA